jgi:hypothetical protein
MKKKKYLFRRYRVCQIITLPNLFSGKGMTNKTNGDGLAPSNQTVGCQLRTTWLAKPDLDLAKSQFDEPCGNL